MEQFFITEQIIQDFKNHLRLEEKSSNTIQKYIRDITAFQKFVNNNCVTKELAIKYKETLMLKKYTVSTVNSVIASLNSFFLFCGYEIFKIKTIKEQRQMFCPEEKDIAKLADILGHSSINTTRIYIISTGTEHRQRMENMRLVI